MPGDYNLYIKGEWTIGLGPSFASHDPATGQILWLGTSAYETDVQAAVSSAKGAFKDWSDLPLKSRVSYLRKFVNVLERDKDAFAELISKETGKPLWEAKAEVGSMLAKVDISIEAQQNRCAELVKELPSGRSITRHRAHGVAAIFGPYNFPGHLPNGHIIPALLAGNTVIFKPSELTPAVGEQMTKCWEEAGLPRGVFNLLQGGHETGKALAENPDIDALYFTGSWNTGKLLSELFGKHPEKLLALEMGGNNPLVIGELNDKKAAAYIAAQSAYLTSGQRCTCARRLIVEEGEKGEVFLGELVKLVQGLKVGAFTDRPEPFMGPVISNEAAARLLKVQENLKIKGGRSTIEMRLLKEGTGLLSPGLMDVTDIENRKDEEYFGPFLQVIRVKDFQEALKEANRTEYGLAAGILSDSKEQYQLFYNHIRAGIINWNTPLTGASSAAPFGGVGKSGNHRPSAYYAADYCSYPTASMESNELKIPSQLLPGIDLNPPAEGSGQI